MALLDNKDMKKQASALGGIDRSKPVTRDPNAGQDRLFSTTDMGKWDNPALSGIPVKGKGTMDPNARQDRLFQHQADEGVVGIPGLMNRPTGIAPPQNQTMMANTSYDPNDPRQDPGNYQDDKVVDPQDPEEQPKRWKAGDIGPDGRKFIGYSRGKEIWGPYPKITDTPPEGTSDPIEQYMRNQVGTPQLAEAATQKYTSITAQEGEDISMRQMEQRGPVETPGAVSVSQGASGQIGAIQGVQGSTIGPFQEATAATVTVAELEAARQAEIAATGSVSPTTAAKYEAALAAKAEATKVANGTVTRLVDAVTGELSDGALAKAAIQELDQVDPRSLVEAKTHEVPNGATVRGQLDNLLGDLEEGNVPAWAQPAVAQTEAMLASRGLSTSSVGKQALFNAIISSAMPIAQQDAKSKLSVFQQDISNEQQATLANAQFFQTLTAQNLSNKQQTALANAATIAKMDLANADRQQQAQIENARNFLQMDLANLSAEQQANLLDSQNRQQQLLSNQAAENSARQFNAASQQQADQFNSNLAAEMDKFNVQQANSMAQFNTAQQNQQAIQQAQLEQQAALTQAQLTTDVSQQTATLSAQQASQQAQLEQQAGIATMQTQAQLAQSQAQLEQQMSIANMQMAAETAKFNAQMEAQVSQFNAQMDFNRDQFNVQNATAIEQSNVQWRRQMNQINTAGENAVNQANAMNAFNLSNQALTFLWQENRDKAKWAFEAGQNEEERKTRMAIAALGNEALKDQQTVSNITSLVSAAASLFDNWGD